MERGRGRARKVPQNVNPERGQGEGPGAQRGGGAWGQTRGSAPRGGGGRAAAPQQGAWGGKGPEHQIRGPAPATSALNVGRASYRTEQKDPGPISEHRGATMTGDIVVSGAHSGRGAHRGAKVVHENILKTKPEHIQTKKGSSGRPINLKANYFELSRPDWSLFQYRVDFTPDDDQMRNRKQYLRTAVKDLNISGYLFDGTVMYTPYRIHNDRLEKCVKNVSEGAEMVQVVVRLVGEVDVYDYKYIQVFNLIMKKCMYHLKLQLIRRDYFDPQAVINISEFKLCVWPGYVTSIRQHESKILLCCDVAHKVLRLDSAYDYLLECSQNARGNFKKAFSDAIVGTVILTTYNNRTYRVDDVDFKSSPLSTFQKADGTSVSYVEYYKERYGIKIHNMDQPLLISIAKGREIRAGMPETLSLIPELCKMTGLSDQQKSNFQLMKAVSNHTRLGPHDRLKRLQMFARRVMESKEAMEDLKAWDFGLHQETIKFAGRVLPNLQIIGGDKREFDVEEADWTRHLRNLKMYADPPLKSWCIICPSKFQGGLTVFMENLRKASQGLKWTLGQPAVHKMRGDNIREYMETIDAVMSNSNIELILIVVPYQKNDMYGAIKKKCCVDKGIPSQVIVARTLDGKGGLSVATKVVIQLCCKIGGAPWTVKIPLNNMMVIGYDACHDPQNKNKTIGAVVCSLDKQLTRYFSQASSHPQGEELSNYFSISVMKAVQEYRKMNGVFPDRFLIYRDGVGDGQIQYVVDHEIEILRKNLQDQLGQQPLKMAFIIVSKRINTRIFGEKGNPPPGTVVDDVITLPERYDFFLVSQCSRIGTVSPTSYNVIYDNFGLDADKLQQLTYKMTHMYYNWSGNIRVPAPCQYAHKLAFLTAQALHRTANPQLNNLLYYL